MKPYEEFSNDLDNIASLFIKSLRKSFGNKVSSIELARIISQIDFFKILNELGYAERVKIFIDKFDDEIIELIKTAKKRGVDKVSEISLSNLETLKELNANTILRSGQYYADKFKGELLKSIISGSNTNELVKDLLPIINDTVPFRPNWLTTAYETAYEQFNSLAKQEIFGKDKNVKWELIHPHDNKTRPQCITAINIMKEYPNGLTIAQINKGILGKYKIKNEEQKYDYVNRGGFNCRGYWRIKL